VAQKHLNFPKDYKLAPDGVYVAKRRTGATSLDYTDGIEAEEKLYSIITGAKDKSVLSSELRIFAEDFISSYHLSPKRANLLRPLSGLLRGRVLEAGAGCGAVTRFLGENGAELVALEGSRIRARIARARTQDQPNVSVVCGRIEAFSAEEPFDAIVVIGCLEYARRYIKGDSPELLFLTGLRRLLKPTGVLGSL
jgi:O-antigen biosynthesis protein